MSGKIVDLVKNLALPVLEKNNLELYDIEFVKQAGEYFLRVYIDCDRGVNINDCENVNRELSKILDDKDPIEHEYILEVSSPGIERTLKTEQHYKKYIGYNVKISLYKPINNQKMYIGKLIDIDNDNIKIESENQLLLLSRKMISNCKLTFEEGEN